MRKILKAISKVLSGIVVLSVILCIIYGFKAAVISICKCGGSSNPYEDIFTYMVVILQLSVLLKFGIVGWYLDKLETKESERRKDG